MFKRRWGSTFCGCALLTLVACGRSTQNSAEPEEVSSGGASPNDGESSTHSGGSAGEEPSAGDSGGSTEAGGTGAGGASGTVTGGAGGTGALGGSGGSASAANGAGGSNDPGSCAWGTYDTDLTDDELTCEPWSVCQPGTFQQEFGDTRHDRLCEPCPAGSWNDAVASSCKPTTKCFLGQQVAVEPSSVNDRVCAPADVFAWTPLTYEEPIGGLVVTDQGAYLAVGRGLVGYSLDGEQLGSFGTDPDQAGLADLAFIGSDLFAAATKYDYDTDASVFAEPGFVKKFTADGTLVWEHALAAEPRDHVTSIRIASHEEAIYAVARVEDRLCTLTVDGSISCLDADYGQSRLVLGVVDTQGAEVSYETLEADTNVHQVHSVAVSSDGMLYVGVSRTVLHFADNCEELAETADPLYYYYYCQTGVAFWHAALLQFDGTELVAEHDLGDLGGRSLVLRADAADGVHAMAFPVDQPEPAPLYRVDGSGELLQSTVDLEGDHMFAFAVTDAGLAFVGITEAGPLLVRTNADGQVLSRHVLEDTEIPGPISGLQEAGDGRLFLGGGGSDEVFVVPWPE